MPFQMVHNQIPFENLILQISKILQNLGTHMVSLSVIKQNKKQTKILKIR